MSASLPGPLVFVFPCRSQFGGRNNVCQMLQCSVRFTGRCFEWSLRAEGRVFEMEHRACFPWRVRIGAVALVVAMAKVKRSLKILLFFFSTVALARQATHRPRAAWWWERPRQLSTSQPASIMSSRHPSTPSARGHRNCPHKDSVCQAERDETSNIQLVLLLLSAEVSWHYCALTALWTISPPFHSL